MAEYELRGVEQQSELVRLDHIVTVLRLHEINTVEIDDLVGLSEDSIQFEVVTHIKELPGDVESIGRQCFGDKWQEGKWI